MSRTGNQAPAILLALLACLAFARSTRAVGATYLGGPDGLYLEGVQAIAVVDGEVYVAGETSSAAFPGVAGGAMDTLSGVLDLFVARLSPDLRTVLQATYFGGKEIEEFGGLAVTSDGVYITGRSGSGELVGSDTGAQPRNHGASDVFVARLSRDLRHVEGSTFFGGRGPDTGWAITVADGSVYVTGFTTSDDLPATGDSAQPQLAGIGSVSYPMDAFVARFSADLSTVRATYLGGKERDFGRALVVEGDTLWVAGSTDSSDFPATFGGAQAIARGSSNATPVNDFAADNFVARLDVELRRVEQATYLGGGSLEKVADLELGLTGDLYLAGSTTSRDHPFTGLGAQPTYRSKAECLVARLDASLTGTPRASFLGGSGWDECDALLVLPEGVFIAGSTTSSNLPATAAGAQPISGGHADAMVHQLTEDLSVFINGSYLGGASSDAGMSLAAEAGRAGSTRAIYLGGSTDSSWFPFVSLGAQTNLEGVRDGFVSRWAPDLTH